ncbi:Mediator of RNA polymerase II transcription subunit 6 [Coemansia javaensis]|uniref:Mediator of RNA polymerase II transcription subunit 6 n=1 Tax=Coemansia javaensis TaxID=2761396 RepID=A0A9W8LIF6_9FUNG|nr:Mediator of RNA polymerase II transcription subunit 6 [Coemansia javaensis]
MATELTGIEWRSDQWLFQFGGLRPENVLEYFSQSPFWDSSSNNAVLKMQTQHSSGLQPAAHDLTRMVGVEFAVTHADPPALFVITKSRRSSPTRTTPLAVYYILDGNAYEAPSLYSVVSSRILTSVKRVEAAFDVARAHAVFHPATGYSWQETPAQKAARKAALRDIQQAE